MNLTSTYLFWPVRTAGILDGWVYGSYASLSTLGMKELLEQKRLRWGKRHREMISERQVQQSHLHHEALGVALETENLLYETLQMDTQRYCEPVALVSQDRAKQAFVSFINLPEKNEGAAMSYIDEFGEFDHLEVDDNGFIGSQIPEGIQRICKEMLDKREDPFAVSLSEFWAVRNNIMGLWDLSLAISAGDSQKARNECIRRRPNSNFDQRPNWVAVAKAILCSDFSAALNPGSRNPRLILSERAGKLVALTMGTTVRTGLYLTLLDMIVSKTEYRTCPQCQERFLPTVENQKFCKRRCQNVAKVRKFRERQKSSKSKKHKRKRPAPVL